MSLTVSGTQIAFPDASTQNTAATGFGFKNRIINGAMMIDQRNAGASGTASAYTVDRWQYYGSQASKLTWQQNAGAVTPPNGFKNYIGVTSSSAYSVLSGDLFQLLQNIEGLNVGDLNWGTANASPVTLSFWVRSSLTGSFGGSLYNSGGSRSYPFSYTISSANAWEYKTITIAGDTTGTWLATNGIGIGVNFNLGAGSTYSGTANTWASANYVAPTGATSVVGTNGATFYITGVQLEKGSTATSFDYRPYGTELALCQRYFEKIGFGDSSSYSPGIFGWAGFSGMGINAPCQFAVVKRAIPTLVVGAFDGAVNATAASGGASTNGFRFGCTSTNTANVGGYYTTGGITASAEL